MANNGYKQATIAYKTDRDGNPVDINGQLTSVSGNRQAIALLIGENNPNPAVYEIEMYFAKGALIGGVPSVSFDPSGCPFGYILATPSTLNLTPANTSGEVHLESSNSWKILNTPNFIRTDIINGGTGAYTIKVDIKNTPLTAGTNSGAIRNNGTIDTSAARYRRTSAPPTGNPFVIPTGKNIYYTGTIDDPAYAAAAYFNVNGEFIGYELNAVGVYRSRLLSPPPGAYYVASCSVGVNPIIEATPDERQGAIVFINNINNLTAEVYVTYLISVRWVLANGTWDNNGTWLNNEIWQ